MNLNRLAKTIFLVELISGLFMAVRELFRKSKTVNYPFEKGPVSPSNDEGETTALRKGTQMAKKDVLPVNCVKQFVLPSNHQTIHRERSDGSRKTTRYDIDMPQMYILWAFVKKFVPS